MVNGTMTPLKDVGAAYKQTETDSDEEDPKTDMKEGGEPVEKNRHDRSKIRKPNSS